MVNGARIVQICFVIIIFMILAVVKIHAPLGIDIGRYIAITTTSVSDWGWYYLAEPVSWLILYGVFNAIGSLGAGYALLVLDLILFSLIIWLTPSNRIKKSMIPFMLLTPVGVMLSMNTLRQYISLVFVIISLCYFIEGKGKRSLFYQLLAVLSHNSALVFLAAVAVYKYGPKNNVIVFSLGVICCFAVAVASRLGYLDVLFAREVILNDPIEKTVGYVLYGTILVAFLYVRHKLFRSQSPHFANKAFSYCIILYVLAIAVTLLPLPVWMINRIWIGVGFVVLFFLFGLSYGHSYNRSRYQLGLFTMLLVALNLIALLNHGGAMSMLVGNKFL